MKQTSIWKKVVLFSFGAVFALQAQLVRAQDDTSSVKSTTGDEECVITDDQL